METPVTLKVPSGRSRAMNGLLALAIFYTLYLGRAFFLPVTLAILLSLLLRPLVRVLKRLHLPMGVGAALVLCLALGGIVWGVIVVYQPAADWVARAPESLRQVERKIRQVRWPMEAMGKAFAQIEELTSPLDPDKPQVELKQPGLREALVGGATHAFTSAVVGAFLLYFLLATDSRFLAKIPSLISGVRDDAAGAALLKETERSISRYLVTITLINGCLGLAVGLAMWLIGIPNPLLWGVMAALLTYVPYLGPATGITILALVSLLTFDSPGHALLAPASYLVLASLEGMVITPFILGRRFAINPVVLFIWLIFWGWLWGIVGALAAMPMLTILKIISERIPALARVNELLGRD